MNLGFPSKKTIKTFTLATLVLTAIATTLRTFCLAFGYDYLSEGVGYYTRGALSTVFHVVCLVAVLFFLFAAFVSKKGIECSDGKEENLLLKVACVFVMLGFAAFFAGTINSTEFVNVSVAFDLLIKISSLMSIACFAVNIFGGEARKLAQVVLGFGTVVWLIAILAITYFDIYVPMNSPDKVHLHFALLALIVFLVSEYRSFLIKINIPVYIFTLFATVFFSCVETVPSLIKYFALGMAEYDYLYYDIVIFTLFLYTLTRLLSFAFSIDTRKKDELPSVENFGETETEE